MTLILAGARIPAGLGRLDGRATGDRRIPDRAELVDVVIDGVTFRPGATVWCDPDGILVERQQEARQGGE